MYFSPRESSCQLFLLQNDVRSKLTNDIYFSKFQYGHRFLQTKVNSFCKNINWQLSDNTSEFITMPLLSKFLNWHFQEIGEKMSEISWDRVTKVNNVHYCKCVKFNCELAVMSMCFGTLKIYCHIDIALVLWLVMQWMNNMRLEKYVSWKH